MLRKRAVLVDPAHYVMKLRFVLLGHWYWGSAGGCSKDT
jgi:hypothetical protein